LQRWVRFQETLYAVYAEKVTRARSTPLTADWEAVTAFDEK